MPSPFPGMDPYLEGYLWPDVHHRLATEISRQLTPRLRPRYVARLDIYMAEDKTPELELGVLYPDVEIVTARSTDRPLSSGGVAELVITPPPLTVTVPAPVPVRLARVEIRDVARNELVTSIEILSPINKREPGLTAYRDKYERLRQSGVHVLEVDLLRRGQRPIQPPRIPRVDYRISLTRAGANRMDVWPLGLRDPLPVVPVPLRPPDPDVPLALDAALATIYEDAAYDLSIDYTQPPPPPPLSTEDAAWLDERLQAVRGTTENN